MYTQCSHCRTAFEIGAEDLRRAHGRVRCGQCGAVFDAIQALTPEPPPGESSPPRFDDDTPFEVVLASLGDEPTAPRSADSAPADDDGTAGQAGTPAVARGEDADLDDEDEWRALLAELDLDESVLSGAVDGPQPATPESGDGETGGTRIDSDGELRGPPAASAADSAPDPDSPPDGDLRPDHEPAPRPEPEAADESATVAGVGPDPEPEDLEVELVTGDGYEYVYVYEYEDEDDEGEDEDGEYDGYEDGPTGEEETDRVENEQEEEDDAETDRVARRATEAAPVVEGAAVGVGPADETAPEPDPAETALPAVLPAAAGAAPEALPPEQSFTPETTGLP